MADKDSEVVVLKYAGYQRFFQPRSYSQEERNRIQNTRGNPHGGSLVFIVQKERGDGGHFETASQFSIKSNPLQHE